MQVPIIKCHGSGNDFVMLHEQAVVGGLSSSQWAEFARRVSDRKGPIGSDGILIVANSGQYDGKMIMYNADGSQAEMCGNGMRCVAREIFQQHKKSTIAVEIIKGRVPCELMPEIHPGVFTVKTYIQPVNLLAKEVPINATGDQVINQIIPALDEKAQFTALSIPNPHLIAIVEEIDIAHLTHWGEQVLLHREIFPQGINVSMVKPLGTNHVYVATYERGCGLTQACGTAISSSSFVSCLNGVCAYDQEIIVETAGGVSFCKVSRANPKQVELIGNATYDYRAIVEFDENNFSNFQLLDKVEFPEESTAFAAMLRVLRK